MSFHAVFEVSCHPVRSFALIALIASMLAWSVSANAGDAAPDNTASHILIGLDATMTGDAGQSGTAIHRGIVLAVNEINATGGVLGRRLDLVIRDNRGNPDRGIDNIEEFAAMPDLVAVVGGIHTPVALAEIDTIHREQLIYLGPWAAGTPLVDNGHEPNFVFRVSVRDEFAGEFLIDAARDRGFTRPGLLLWRTGWGRSNEAAMINAMRNQGIEVAGVEWFNTSEQDMSDQIDALMYAGADVVMLVANPRDGLTIVNNMAARHVENRLPIISHWGITGGDFYAAGREAISKIDLTFLQTYSFYEPTFPERSDAFFKAYCARFGGCDSYADIVSPVGSVHAYDLVHLLARAMDQAGTTDRTQVRSALESLDRYEGLARVYEPAFTAERHDALDASDFRLCRYGDGGAIIPIAIAVQ
jgi:branched-chain amino acid transport system substrate-binding protein